MSVVEVTVEVRLATIYELVSDVLDLRQAVDSLVVSPSFYPEVELVRPYA